MKPEKIVNHLIYCSYHHNRKISPHVTPERWAKVYGPNTMVMEAKFQKEKESGSELS